MISDTTSISTKTLINKFIKSMIFIYTERTVNNNFKQTKEDIIKGVKNISFIKRRGIQLQLIDSILSPLNSEINIANISNTTHVNIMLSYKYVGRFLYLFGTEKGLLYNHGGIFDSSENMYELQLRNITSDLFVDIIKSFLGNIIFCYGIDFNTNEFKELIRIYNSILLGKGYPEFVLKNL